MSSEGVVLVKAQIDQNTEWESRNIPVSMIKRLLMKLPKWFRVGTESIFRKSCWINWMGVEWGKNLNPCCSVAKSCSTLCDPIAAYQASLSFAISQSLLKLTSIELMTSSKRLILCHPLLLPSIFPSIRVFSNELALCIRWQKFWSFSFNISPSNEYLELISFRIDCFDLLAVQGTLKNPLQHYNWKASVLQHSAF